MKIHNIEAHENDAKIKLYPHLLGRFFHVTSPENWTKILSTGQMMGINVNGSLCPQRTSYGPKRGYICIYDWKNNSKETIEKKTIKLNALFPFGDRCDPVFIIFKSEIEENIIPNEVAVHETEYKERFVPDVECWYPKTISLELIETVLITKYFREIDPIVDILKRKKC